MRYQILYASVATILATLTNAQNLGDLPMCAQTPTLTGIAGTGCSPSDIACVCKDQSFLNSLLPQLEKVCSPSDVAKAVAFAQQLCAQNGVTISAASIPGLSTTPAASASVSASSAPISSATTPVSSGTTAVAGTGGSTATAAMTGSSAAAGTTTTGTATQASATSGTASAAASQSSGSSADSWRLAGGFEGLAAVMGVAGVFAALM